MKKGAHKQPKKIAKKAVAHIKQKMPKVKSPVTGILIAIILLVTIAAIGSIIQRKYGQSKSQQQAEADALKEKMQEEFESNALSEIQTIQGKTDMSTWKEYPANWYGFKIKYPSDWLQPVSKVASRGSKADYTYEFRAKKDDTRSFVGFNVVVYSTSKITKISDTNEFPTKKSEAPECESLDGHFFETGEYSAEEIYVPTGDECYEPSLFFSVTDGQYTYNIVPILREGTTLTGDPLTEISDNLPEFFAIISTFENIDIVRPKPKVVTPARINAPMPAAFKREGGRLVCNKKNDKPGKSKQNKGKHLDMECCLDPDEYPNPHCYYSPSKYGKYLN